MRDFLTTIDERGGMLSSIEDGWIHEMMYDRAYRLETGTTNGDVPIVGVNLFPISDGDGEDDLFGVDDLHNVDAGAADRQIERLAAHRASRSAEEVEQTLEQVRRAARDGGNVCYPLEEAVVAGVTVGECMTALRDVYGAYHEGGKL
jgi:methylmalonyl-CoA mutase N-terminal domain/subunit